MLSKLIRSVRGRTSQVVDAVKTAEALQLRFRQSTGEEMGIYVGPRGEVRSPGLPEKK
jgi:hypothetical protein